MRIVILFLILCTTAFAETVGPRKPWNLIGSVMNVSESKDVMLFNKGHEDGLAEGDHAWFWSHKEKGFRGECLKVSESRSIWQIYRVETEGILQKDVALKARQATKPIFVSSPEDSDQL